LCAFECAPGQADSPTRGASVWSRPAADGTEVDQIPPADISRHFMSDLGIPTVCLNYAQCRKSLRVAIWLVRQAAAEWPPFVHLSRLSDVTNRRKWDARHS
jgi:hypothetical protein